ncbi:O-acyltransferase like protein-like [Pieris brassicae]|uniref:O-acyltransferase like protein-like n=1 Tax=Pieris brassicae TaxID=7116 RepID=UPI001E65E34D|nr:O-acyltransferase like protein-like [Pieris brassicae]
MRIHALSISISASRRNGVNSKKESRPKKNEVHEELMDNLFVIYDPSFLALVWPKIKNGVHLSLDRYCWGELRVLFKDYLDGRAWAYKTADATGRYSASFFSGNKFWLGSKEQCRLLNEAYETRDENETWGEFYSDHQDWHALVERDELMKRVVKADNSPPFTLEYSTLRVELNLTKFSMSYDVTLGVCLPRSCTAEDVVSIINFSIMLNDHLKSNNSLSRSVKCAISRQFESLPPCPRVKYNSCASLTTEYKKKNGYLKSLLLSFSLKHSWMRIFNTNMANKDLSVIHAVKIIATLWVIFINVAVTVSYISGESGDINNNNTMYNILTTGTLAFDTLFFVSGIFSAHHFFYLKGRYSVKQLVACGGPCGQASQVICFITNRIIRLLPPYIYTIFLSTALGRVSEESATLSFLYSDSRNCHKFWWRNLLYISNYYPIEEQCMQISWYLSTEGQLHIIGAFVCFLLTTQKKRWFAFTAVLLLCIPTGFDVFTAFSEAGHRFSDVFMAYDVIIISPWSHVTPYILGVLTGWLVYRIDGLLTVTKVSSSCLWVSSILGALGSCVASGVGAGWLTAWLHLVWPAAWIWPALVCSTKFAYKTRELLNSSLVAGVSRLCYCSLLLHGPVSRYLLLSLDAAICSNCICLWCYFVGILVVTLVAALVISILVEMPTCAFLRRLADLANR